jgi:outer membrane biosynthesis protein TonB
MRKCVVGVVVLKLFVGETGTVLYTTVLSGPIVLAESATAAAKKWTYEPYIFDGKPVRYETQATEKFRAPR